MSTARKVDEINPGFLATLSSLVSSITGVQLGEAQRKMVESRIAKRILDLGLRDLREYESYFASNQTSETGALVSLLTTHHTYFFRETAHFEYLEREGLRVAAEAARREGRNEIRIWSAACSYGQEVYSLAMFCHHHLPRIAPGMTFRIFGTDVDSGAVEIARNGVYHREQIKSVPMKYLHGNWAKGTGEIADFVRARAPLRSVCSFETGNLLALGAIPSSTYDIIFCRNVFIYFTADRVRAITENLLTRLSAGGRLFLGISESAAGLGLPVIAYGPSIYGHATSEAVPIATKAVAPREKIRVLCVDDSPSILSILKRVLTTEHGFEVVATAKNGVEAAKVLADHRVDVMTLDIHMPEQTGLEYLQKNMRPGHPPVVVVSSVSREDAALATACLEAGATDYVEKPELTRFAESAEEIRSKLVSVIRQTSPRPLSLELERAFAKPSMPKTAMGPQSKLRIVATTLTDQRRTLELLKELSELRAPVVVLLEASASELSTFSRFLEREGALKVRELQSQFLQLEPVFVYVGRLPEMAQAIAGQYSSLSISIMIHASVGRERLAPLLALSGAQVLLEDDGKGHHLERGMDQVPATSFAYMSNAFLIRATRG